MAFIAAAAPILSLVGAGISAVGSLQSGMYQAEVSKNNATIAAQNAAYTREAGQEEAGIQSMKGAAEGARTKANMSASGVDVNSGSAVDVQQGEREVEKLDIETVLNNADLRAYGYTAQAVNFKAQSQQDTAGAVWGAAGDLFSGASSLGGKMGTPSGGGSGIGWGRPTVFG